jgi:hypothetical protein
VFNYLLLHTRATIALYSSLTTTSPTLLPLAHPVRIRPSGLAHPQKIDIAHARPAPALPAHQWRLINLGWLLFQISHLQSSRPASRSPSTIFVVAALSSRRSVVHSAVPAARFWAFFAKLHCRSQHSYLRRSFRLPGIWHLLFVPLPCHHPLCLRLLDCTQTRTKQLQPHYCNR